MLGNPFPTPGRNFSWTPEPSCISLSYKHIPTGWYGPMMPSMARTAVPGQPWQQRSKRRGLPRCSASPAWFYCGQRLDSHTMSGGSMAMIRNLRSDGHGRRIGLIKHAKAPSRAKLQGEVQMVEFVVTGAAIRHPGCCCSSYPDCGHVQSAWPLSGDGPSSESTLGWPRAERHRR